MWNPNIVRCICNATTCTSTILPAPRTDVASTYPVLCSRRAMCVSRTRRQPMSLPFPVLYGLPQQCNDAIANCLYYYNCIVPSSVVICTPAKAFGHIARIFVVHLNILLYTLWLHWPWSSTPRNLSRGVFHRRARRRGRWSREAWIPPSGNVLLYYAKNVFYALAGIIVLFIYSIVVFYSHYYYCSFIIDMLLNLLLLLFVRSYGKYYYYYY